MEFPRERAIAVILEAKPNACWHVRVTEVTTDSASGTTTVVVVTYEPPPDAVCGSAVAEPHHFIAIPNDGTVVAFRESATTGPPPS